MKRSAHAAAWVLLAVSAFLLWPERWGGQMTYVVTSGNSMAPTWQAGDLAVLRSTDDYAVGDVAAFRSDEIKHIVMHRVVEEQDGVLRFQGDNNDFVDPDEVREDDVLGRLVLRVPKVGLAIGWLAQPLNLVLMVGGLALVLLDRRERRDEAPAPAPAPVQAAPPSPLLLSVDAVEVPLTAVVADVVCVAEMRGLAERTGRPLLREVGTRTLYVVDAGTVYRCRDRRRRSAPAPLRAVPAPRHAPSSAEVS